MSIMSHKVLKTIPEHVHQGWYSDVRGRLWKVRFTGNVNKKTSILTALKFLKFLLFFQSP